MPFQKIEPDRVAESVITQIEQLILRGIIRPGERLPSERDLADRLGVSRRLLKFNFGDLHPCTAFSNLTYFCCGRVCLWRICHLGCNNLGLVTIPMISAVKLSKI